MKEKNIRTLIVDDEAHARLLIRNVLDLFPNPIEVVGEATHLPEAVRFIHELKPDLLFLDINMPNHSGLQIGDFLTENHNILIVFVTAHSEYAIEAIRSSAFDYLLKPIQLKQLQQCVERVEKEVRKRKKSLKENGEQLIEINTQHQTHYINVADIEYIEASAMYAIIHTAHDQLVVSKPLKEYLFLENNGFYRIHRSYLVNTTKIKKLSSLNGTRVILGNNKSLAVSRSVKEKFKIFMREKFNIG